MYEIVTFIVGILVGVAVAGAFFPKVKDALLRRRKGPSFVQSSTKSSVQLDIEGKLWHEQETDFMLRLNETLSLYTDSTKVIKNVVEGIHDFFFVQRTVLLLADKETEELHIGHTAGMEGEMLAKFSLKKRESISGYIIEGKRPLVVDDLQGEYFLKKLNKEPYLQKSFVGVPIISGDETLGIFFVCDKKAGHPFTKRDISFLVHVGKMVAIALQNSRLHEQIHDGYLTMITTLAAAIDARDHYTESHSESVTKYAMAIAEEMKYPTMQRETLRRAALLHDIGKIGIKDELLLKTDALTDDEREQFQRHPEIGERIIRSLSFLKEASILTRHHHEHYDGSGYPDGLQYDEIEWGARILCVADAFDAMTSDRPYRKALSYEAALQQLEECKGTQFDPIVVDCFMEVLKKHPTITEQDKIFKDAWNEYGKKTQ